MTLLFHVISEGHSETNKTNKYILKPQTYHQEAHKHMACKCNEHDLPSDKHRTFLSNAVSD